MLFKRERAASQRQVDGDMQLLHRFKVCLVLYAHGMKWIMGPQNDNRNTATRLLFVTATVNLRF